MATLLCAIADPATQPHVWSALRVCDHGRVHTYELKLDDQHKLVLGYVPSLNEFETPLPSWPFVIETRYLRFWILFSGRTSRDLNELYRDLLHVKLHRHDITVCDAVFQFLQMSRDNPNPDLSLDLAETINDYLQNHCDGVISIVTVQDKLSPVRIRWILTTSHQDLFILGRVTRDVGPILMATTCTAFKHEFGFVAKPGQTTLTTNPVRMRDYLAVPTSKQGFLQLIRPRAFTTRAQRFKSFVLCSGGLDSTVTAKLELYLSKHHTVMRGEQVYLLCADYGQPAAYHEYQTVYGLGVSWASKGYPVIPVQLNLRDRFPKPVAHIRDLPLGRLRLILETVQACVERNWLSSEPDLLHFFVWASNASDTILDLETGAKFDKAVSLLSGVFPSKRVKVKFVNRVARLTKPELLLIDAYLNVLLGDRYIVRAFRRNHEQNVVHISHFRPCLNPSRCSFPVGLFTEVTLDDPDSSCRTILIPTSQISYEELVNNVKVCPKCAQFYCAYRIFLSVLADVTLTRSVVTRCVKSLIGLPEGTLDRLLHQVDIVFTHPVFYEFARKLRSLGIAPIVGDAQRICQIS